jgi:hypothetical protein
MRKILAFGIVIAMMFALAVPAMAQPITITAPKGTPAAIDGVKDDAYGDWISLNVLQDGVPDGATGRAAVAWDDDWIYVIVEANDPSPHVDHGDNWQTDNVEIFFDWNNHKGESIDNDDQPFWQARIHRAPGENEWDRTGHANDFWSSPEPDNDHPFYHIRYAVIENNTSYIVEAAFPRSAIEGGFTFAEGVTVGFDVNIMDNHTGDGHYSRAMFYDSDDNSMWNNPSHLKALLVLGAAPAVADEPEAAGGGEEADAETPLPRPTPRTGDAGVMALIALMAIAAAGIVVIRRKAVK